MNQSESRTQQHRAGDHIYYNIKLELYVFDCCVLCQVLVHFHPGNWRHRFPEFSVLKVTLFFSWADVMNYAAQWRTSNILINVIRIRWFCNYQVIKQKHRNWCRCLSFTAQRFVLLDSDWSDAVDLVPGVVVHVCINAIVLVHHGFYSQRDVLKIILKNYDLINSWYFVSCLCIMYRRSLQYLILTCSGQRSLPFAALPFLSSEGAGEGTNNNRKWLTCF